MTQPGPQAPHGSVNADTSQSTVHRGSIADTTIVQTTQAVSRNSHSGGDSTTSSSRLSSHTAQLDTSSSVEINNPELENKVLLDILLVSGKRYTFSFEPGDTVTRVKNLIFTDWPK
ncbi:17523_t:CDS:1, partial [Acaulospora morrowiae]